MEVFWDGHYAAEPPWSRQYMSIVLYHNDEQRQIAIASKEREEARLGTSLVTEITPFSEFYLAEDYHQKYYLRRMPDIMAELSAIYPDFNDFISSTAVARVNGYALGYGTQETFEEELGRLGLSETGEKRLLEAVEGGLAPDCAVPYRDLLFPDGEPVQQ